LKGLKGAEKPLFYAKKKITLGDFNGVQPLYKKTVTPQ
jgi:hypothetical protein